MEKEKRDWVTLDLYKVALENNTDAEFANELIEKAREAV
jgi:hypothetical protein